VPNQGEREKRTGEVSDPVNYLSGVQGPPMSGKKKKKTLTADQRGMRKEGIGESKTIGPGRRVGIKERNQLSVVRQKGLKKHLY